MKKSVNGYIKLFFISLAIAGIVWNAATLHNDVKHLKNTLVEVKCELKELREIIIKGR